jgi:hypothetical protein
MRGNLGGESRGINFLHPQRPIFPPETHTMFCLDTRMVPLNFEQRRLQKIR